MKISKRIISLLMAALLVFGLPLSAFASDGGEIRISTAEDWKSFVKNCKLDTWSVGKTVVLDTDLDLGGNFTPVPVFSGTFDRRRSGEKPDSYRHMGAIWREKRHWRYCRTQQRHH